MNSTNKNSQRGAALLVAMFALMLLLAIAFVMIFMTNTESKIGFNFKENKQSYYSARAGLEEVRDRMRYTATALPGGIANLIPTAPPGQTGSVLYVLNPDTTIGESANPASSNPVNPVDPNNKYFDIEFCHEWNSGVTDGVQCPTGSSAKVPSTSGWNNPAISSAAVGNGHTLPYKWVRINEKTNRSTKPYCVDGTACNVVGYSKWDFPICWDSKKQQEVLTPTGASCGSQGLQQVYMLTSYAINPAVSSGARSISRYEVVGPIAPPTLAGAIEMESPSRSRGDFSGPSVPPLTTVDARAHDINGNLAPGGSCADTTPFATDATTAGGGNGDELPGDLNDMEKQVPSAQCVGTSPNCTNGFIGVPGNTANGIVNQQPSSTIVSQVTPINNLINSAIASGSTLNWSQGVTSGGTLTFGSLANPVVVNVTNTMAIDGGPAIKGFGILVVNQDFELKNVNFQWTGLVVIKNDQTEFRIDTNATGFINGALVMQGSEARTRLSDSDSGVFNINYSCDAINMAFRPLPLRIVSYSEVSY